MMKIGQKHYSLALEENPVTSIAFLTEIILVTLLVLLFH